MPKKIVTNKMFSCSHVECPRQYTTNFSLQRHMSTHEVKSHICIVCNKAFGLAQYLKEHQTIHAAERLFKCPEPNCFKSFRQASKLSSHRLKHKLLLFDVSKVKSVHFEEIAHTILQQSDNILKKQVSLPCPVSGCAYNTVAALKPIAIGKRRQGLDFFEDHLTKSIENLVNNVSVTASSS